MNDGARADHLRRLPAAAKKQEAKYERTLVSH